MGIESIFHKWLVKDGKVSLPFVLQISSFLFFSDISIRLANLNPFVPWKSPIESMPGLLMTFVPLLVVYCILSRFVAPLIVLVVRGIKAVFFTRASTKDYGSQESVLESHYERYALETNNASALSVVIRQKEERDRYFENGVLFLMWAWLAWGEMVYCLPYLGTIGNQVSPIVASRMLFGLGFLACLAITAFWISDAENLPSSRIRVSQQLRKEINEREKGIESSTHRGFNPYAATIGPPNFPSGPLIGNLRSTRSVSY